MTPGPADVSNHVQSGLEKGLEAYFATDTITQVLDAVDVDALLSGEGLEEPMEYEKMGELVGQMTGRLIVRNSVGRYTPGQTVEQFVGYAVGGVVGKRVGQQLERSQIERVLRDVARDANERDVDDLTPDRRDGGGLLPFGPGGIDDETEPVRIDIEDVEAQGGSSHDSPDSEDRGSVDIDIDDAGGDIDDAEDDIDDADVAESRQDETDVEHEDDGDEDADAGSSDDDPRQDETDPE